METIFDRTTNAIFPDPKSENSHLAILKLALSVMPTDDPNQFRQFTRDFLSHAFSLSKPEIKELYELVKGCFRKIEFVDSDAAWVQRAALLDTADFCEKTELWNQFVSVLCL